MRTTTKIHVFLRYLVGAAFLCQEFCDAKVMMEYIGATGARVSFNEVPVKDKIDFYFILGFAIDADSSSNPQNGIFSPYWADSLTPASVATIKSRHANVKVLASLSGWSVNDNVLTWYTPKNPKLWISNAFKSLNSIVKKYHLDGIDVDYETFPKNDSSFASCIGELITNLKKQRVISVATIAPFHNTIKPYVDLYRKFGLVIDYVNYQFYTDKIRVSPKFLEVFKLRASQFDRNKLLPSYEVNGRGIQGDEFFDVLRLLEKTGFSVKGVMIFSADASSANDYYYERKSQDFLLKSK
ncbi:hypothetical protein K2173_001026 [Erythroxylum novogranatense]|uniref:GH18 domain-containing protein n=1 Tax=Erythroxylum novogranatense TaxID=1862640 RepID=A0AAV8SIZ0_9ROSI|nr:hypothetical protein K2173_001026 [Erythroxylum novogranatense]